jgi:hypothetical protein
MSTTSGKAKARPPCKTTENHEMKIPATPFTVTDWSSLPATTHPGETGQALWRTLNFGDLRVRLVEYTPGYLADHWCDRGHVLYVVEGELDTELRDGRTFKLKPGMSYQEGPPPTRRGTGGGSGRPTKKPRPQGPWLSENSRQPCRIGPK